jgi:hypothetical protein
MENALNEYINAIKNDYANQKWSSNSEVKNKMIEEFNNGLSYIEGKKYIKVVKNGSVHSFIVKENEGKFRKGDILKAASWNAPAKNHARGNIFGIYHISWTGADYMR